MYEPIRTPLLLFALISHHLDYLVPAVVVQHAYLNKPYKLLVLEPVSEHLYQVISIQILIVFLAVGLGRVVVVWIPPHDPLHPPYPVQAPSASDATGRVCNHLFVDIGFDDLHDCVGDYLPRVIRLIFQIPDFIPVRPALHLPALVLRKIQI